MKQINFKRIISAGLVVDLISIILPAISYYLFKGVFELEPSKIWKWTPKISIISMPLDWLVINFLINTAIAIFVVFLFAYFYNSLPFSGAKKGIVFALLLYPICVLMPMFSIYVLVNVNFLAIIYFTLEGLIEFIAYGAVAGVIYRNKNRL